MQAPAPMAFSLALLVLAGCSSPEGSGPETDSEGRYVIHLTADNRFVPDDARVPVGATVAWVVDGGHHDVNADDGSFSSFEGRPLDANGYPTLHGPGETFTHTFNEKGTWEYWCHTHHEFGMKGVIRVT